jgi:O-antigen ligase
MSDRQNLIAWNFLQLGVLFLSLIPALGGVGIFIAALVTIAKQGRSILQSLILKTIVLILICISVSSIVISFFANNSIDSWLGLANLLPYFILLPSLPLTIDNAEKLRRIARLFVISSPIVVILGLGQIFGGWSFNTIFGWDLVAGGLPAGRMSSVFINCNFLGLYLAICVAFCLGSIVDNWLNDNKKILFFSTIAAIDLSGIIVVGSRNAWAISFAIFLAFALYLGWNYLVLFIVGILSAIGWSAYGFGNSRNWLRTIIPIGIWGRLSGETDAEIPDAFTRITQWKFTLHLIQERPWLGWGLRNFTPLYREETGFWLGHPHNLFLMFGAEMGLPTTIFFIGSIGWIVIRSIIILWYWQREKSELNGDRTIFFTYLIAFLACVAFNLVDVSLYDFRNNITAWILLAAIVGIIERERRKTSQQNPPFLLKSKTRSKRRKYKKSRL